MSQTAFLSSGSKVGQVATVRQAHLWATLQLSSAAHEARVMRLAAAMWRILEPVHQLPPRYRRMLRLGAILHDIGRVDGARRHHVRGAQMIAQGRCPVMSEAERCFAAYAARHHRGAIPAWEDDERASLGSDRRAMRMLLAILRAADALDKRTLVPPTIMLRWRGRELIVDIAVSEQWRKAKRAFRHRRKYQMLAEELGVIVRVRIYPVS